MSDGGPEQSKGPGIAETPANEPDFTQQDADILNTSAGVAIDPAEGLGAFASTNQMGLALEAAKDLSYNELSAFATKQDVDSDLSPDQLEFLRDIMEPVNTGVYDSIHQSLEARLASVPAEEREAASAFAYEAMTLAMSKIVEDNAIAAMLPAFRAVSDRLDIQENDPRLHSKVQEALSLAA